MSLDNKSLQEIIEAFNLLPLEGEGGYFSHVHSTPEGNSIYFMLQKGDFSAWHRLHERETWVLLAGDSFELHIYDGAYSSQTFSRDDAKISYSVDPGDWMAAQTVGEWSLILCYLAPAFSGMELATRDTVRTWIAEDSRIPELVHE